MIDESMQGKEYGFCGDRTDEDEVELKLEV